MSSIGLKLWSTNTDFYLEEAKKLLDKKIIDYIELYVVPNTVDTIKKWKTINTVYAIHAPHFANGVNLADRMLENNNMKVYEEVSEFEKELSPIYTVIHGGMDGNVEETIRQINNIKLKNKLIENKPYIPPFALDKKCRGAVIDEIKKIIEETGCGFCLDIGHAICAYNSMKNLFITTGTKDQYDCIAKFNTLNPFCYHVSDNFIDNDMDSHLHMGEGNYDFKRIFNIIDMENRALAIETRKNNKENLDDFFDDVNYIKSCMKQF